MRKNSGNILFIVLVLVGVVVAGATGYFYWSKLPEISRQKNPSPETLVSTTGWQVCNDSRGFTMKYPPGFQLNPGSCDYFIENYAQIKSVKGNGAVTDLQENWLITTNIEQSDLAPDQWLRTKMCSGSPLCSNIVPGPISNSSSVNINSHYTESDVAVKVGGKIVAFSLNARNPDTPVSLNIRQVFDQIISTFKFLPNEVFVTMNAQNNTGETGLATLTNIGNGETKVVLGLENVPGSGQPVNIYSGSCSSLGQVKYPLNALLNGLKTNLAPGKSETILNISLSDVVSAPRAIGVRYAESFETPFLASCGDL